MKIENYKLISSLNDAPVMITVGMFDGVHRGHRYFVREMTKEAKKRKLIPVIVTMYPHPKEILSDKEFRYLTSLPEKKHYMKQLGIEHVLVLKTTKSLLNSAADEFINALQSAGLNIKAIAMGYNNNFGKKLDEKVNFEAVVKRKGISLFTVPAFSETVNSTLVREKLLHGKVDDAAALLGHPYVLFGHVVEGNKIGRGMGYPTANIKVDSIEKMIPAVGVYAVKCHVNDAVYSGMMNIGYRPTVREKTRDLVLEVHVPGEKLDIYNHPVKIEFYKKIRDERQFNGLDELKAQLDRDRDFIEGYFQKTKNHHEH